MKVPTDLWTYHELIWRIQPQLIIEAGTAYGGSALYMADMLDLTGQGRVVTIDIENQGQPPHPRVEYLIGSSIDPVIVGRFVGEPGPVMVTLDSDHSRDHVLAELRAYSDLVTPGSYMIVEDTNVNGHPVRPSHGPGPWEAVECFLAEDARFQIDSSCERHMLTLNPRGYLKRLS